MSGSQQTILREKLLSIETSLGVDSLLCALVNLSLWGAYRARDSGTRPRTGSWLVLNRTKNLSGDTWWPGPGPAPPELAAGTCPHPPCVFEFIPAVCLGHLLSVSQVPLCLDPRRRHP